MRKAVAFTALLFGFTLTAVPEVSAMAQVSLQNNTSFWLNLYIDGNFGCGPVMPNGFCTSSVTAGSHLLEARKGQEVVASQGAVNIGDGTSPTWTVTIEDPAQELVRKLNGARYVSNRTWPKIGAEYELVIRGTKLVWRMRFTWAAPEIVLQRPVGTWTEIDQAQIIGREAHSYHQTNSPQRKDILFTISEDGSSIIEKDGNSVYSYSRQ